MFKSIKKQKQFKSVIINSINVSVVILLNTQLVAIKIEKNFMESNFAKPFKNYRKTEEFHF